MTPDLNRQQFSISQDYRLLEDYIEMLPNMNTQRNSPFVRHLHTSIMACIRRVLDEMEDDITDDFVNTRQRPFPELYGNGEDIIGSDIYQDFQEGSSSDGEPNPNPNDSDDNLSYMSTPANSPPAPTTTSLHRFK